MGKNIYVVKGRKTIKFPFEEDVWKYMLNASCSAAIRTRGYYNDTFFGKYHILYGYAMPNVGKYVLSTSTFTDEMFGKLVKDLEEQDGEVMIYAIHS